MNSTSFYWMIYKKSLFNFWNLSLIYIGFITLAILCQECMIFFFFSDSSNFLTSKNKIYLFIVSVLLISIASLPAIISLSKTKKYGGRSPKYINFLKKIKKEYLLSDKELNVLILDIDGLIEIYTEERKSLLKHIYRFCNLLILPSTVAILTYNGVFRLFFYLVILTTSLILSGAVIGAYYFWKYDQIESFRKIGIKNYFMLMQVRVELEYMKSLNTGDELEAFKENYFI